MQKSESTGPRFELRDVVEIALGGSVMAFPVAITEELWNLGTELSIVRVLLFTLASIFFMAILIYGMHGHVGDPSSRKVFWQRVTTTYFLTLGISALLLFGVDRLNVLSEPLVAIKRTILVAFPASFAATVVDGLPGDGRGE
jgi:uncharacterized membrane protein